MAKFRVRVKYEETCTRVVRGEGVFLIEAADAEVARRWADGMTEADMGPLLLDRTVAGCEESDREFEPKEVTVEAV